MFLVASRCGQPVTLALVAVDHADRIMIDRAQIFFERAKALDPDNIVVDSLVTMVRMIRASSHLYSSHHDRHNASVKHLRMQIITNPMMRMYRTFNQND